MSVKREAEAAGVSTNSSELRAFSRGRKKPLVRITSVKTDDEIGQEYYTILPESYAGPWALREGTVLRVVSEPKEAK